MEYTTEYLLDKESMSRRLQKISLYLTAYEILKTVIETKVKMFLCIRMPINEKFEKEKSVEYLEFVVNRRHKELKNKTNKYYSSCKWLEENKVISKKDFAELQTLRKYRNKMAHDLLEVMLTKYKLENYLENIILLVKKIEEWWLNDIELTVNESMMNRREQGPFKSASQIILEHIIEM